MISSRSACDVGPMVLALDTYAQIAFEKVCAYEPHSLYAILVDKSLNFEEDIQDSQVSDGIPYDADFFDLENELTRMVVI